jgi:putative zinc finger/helix-turn-helix YgiT family protein
MKGICPFCEKECNIESIETVEEIKVRGEAFGIETHYLKCKVCDNTFYDPASNHDPLELAYREYRKRRGMMQPEDIKTFRKKYGLSQGELSSILGWGIATLNRYENGALQSQAHEKTLRLAVDPENLLKLLLDSPGALNKEKKERLIKSLQLEGEESFSFQRIFENRFGRYEQSELSGYRKLDLNKLFNAILFFCKNEEGVYKTKLNKLLFYADFKHFKEYVVSITGCRYAHITFGPAPDNYEYYFAALIENKLLTPKEVCFGEDIIGEKFVSAAEPDLSIFGEGELKIMASVKEFFKDFTATQITDYSHEEQGYKETSNGDPISFDYAETLQI